MVFSREGGARKSLGLVTDAPELSAAGLSQTYEGRWGVELFWKDSKPLLGLRQSQNRSYRAAVIPLHLVCFTSALLTHRRLTRPGAHGQQKRQKAADGSLAPGQNDLRCLLWDDLVVYLQAKHPDASVLMALERLRVAS